MRTGDLAAPLRNNLEVTCKRFQNWIAKQRLPPFKETASDAFFCFATSMLIGEIGESLVNTICVLRRTSKSQILARCGTYKPLVESFIARDNIEIGSNIILMRVCNDSVFYVLKNIRGKEDVHTSFVAGFGYGVALSLATGMRGPSILSVAAACALFNAGMFKAGFKMWAYDYKLNTVSWRR